MNKKIPSILAIGIILILSAIIGVLFFFQNLSGEKETPVSIPVQGIPQAKSEFSLASEYCEEFGGRATQWENADKKMEWKCGTSRNDCELFAFYQKKCPMRKIITLEPDTATCASFQKLFDSYKKSITTEEEAGPESGDYKTLTGNFCQISASWNSVLRSNDKSDQLYEKIKENLEKFQWKTSGGADGPSGSVEYYEKGNDQLIIGIYSETDETERQKIYACYDYGNMASEAEIEKCVGKTKGTFHVSLSSGRAVNVEEVYDPMPFKRLNDSRPRN